MWQRSYCKRLSRNGTILSVLRALLFQHQADTGLLKEKSSAKQLAELFCAVHHVPGQNRERLHRWSLEAWFCRVGNCRDAAVAGIPGCNCVDGWQRDKNPVAAARGSDP